MKEQIKTEEATKNAFIMPFIQMLGYDVFNPLEVVPEMDCNLDQCKFPKDEVEVLPPDELLKQYHEKRTALDAKIDKTLGAIMDKLNTKL